jgi:hypothetical protein
MWQAMHAAPVSAITTKPTSPRTSCSNTITEKMCFVIYSILLTIAVHYNDVNMYWFCCLMIIMIYNMILSNVCFFFMQLLLLFIIRVNPDYCSPQIVQINEVLLC